MKLVLMFKSISGSSAFNANKLSLCNSMFSLFWSPKLLLGSSINMRGSSLGSLPLCGLVIEVEILLLFAKDCSGKPDLKGNALKKLILFWEYHHQHFIGVQGLEVVLIKNKTYPTKYRNYFQIISQME